MKLPSLSKRKIVATIILLIGISCLVLLTTGLWHRSEDGQIPSQSDSTKQISADDQQATPGTQSTQTPAVESSLPACQQFTLSTAKAVLGPTAALNTQDSAIISESDDMLVSSCVYHAGSHTVRLGAYVAKAALGESANTVMFGSEKPIGVQDIPGYGQAAYWDAHTGILSVLKNNNRYELSRDADTSSATVDDVLQAADVIIPKL